MSQLATVKREPDAREVARKLAGRRVAFTGHAIVWGLVVLLILVTAGFLPALVVAIAWGIGLASHGFFAVLAPGLRERWTETEVSRRVGDSVVGERRLIEGRHARSLEELSASIAHEIRNPITAAKSLVQQMSEDPACPDNAEYARIAIEELDRVERAVSHLLRYAREEEMRFEDVDLADVVGAALDAMQDRIEKSNVRIERALDFDTRLSGDRDKLRAMAMNLVGNALDALAETAVADPFVRVSTGRDLAGSSVWLRVKDNGGGIEPARLADIWSPFYTSKQGGTGLGLAIVKKIVEAHGGGVEASSAAGAGTEIVVTMPARSAA